MLCLSSIWLCSIVTTDSIRVEICELKSFKAALFAIFSDSESVNQEAVQAIRQSVSQVIAGSKSTQKWISKTNDMWVLVEVKELNTSLLEKNLAKAKGVDNAAAKALAKSVDELIDGFKND